MTISIPADPAYVGLLRSTVASLAAKADFTLDEIEDLRIAVSEAATLLLPLTETINCHVDSRADAVEVTCTCTSEDSPRRDFDDLPWVLLEALVDEAASTVTQSGISIRLLKRRADHNA